MKNSKLPLPKRIADFLLEHIEQTVLVDFVVEAMKEPEIDVKSHLKSYEKYGFLSIINDKIYIKNFTKK